MNQWEIQKKLLNTEHYWNNKKHPYVFHIHIGMFFYEYFSSIRFPTVIRNRYSNQDTRKKKRVMINKYMSIAINSFSKKKYSKPKVARNPNPANIVIIVDAPCFTAAVSWIQSNLGNFKLMIIPKMEIKRMLLL